MIKKLTNTALILVAIAFSIGCSSPTVEDNRIIDTVDPATPVVTSNEKGYCEHDYDSNRSFEYDKTKIYQYETFGRQVTTYAFIMSTKRQAVFLSGDEVENYTCHLIEP